jgi:hypothetical protein
VLPSHWCTAVPRLCLLTANLLKSSSAPPPRHSVNCRRNSNFPVIPQQSNLVKSTRYAVVSLWSALLCLVSFLQTFRSATCPAEGLLQEDLKIYLEQRGESWTRRLEMYYISFLNFLFWAQILSRYHFATHAYIELVQHVRWCMKSSEGVFRDSYFLQSALNWNFVEHLMWPTATLQTLTLFLFDAGLVTGTKCIGILYIDGWCNSVVETSLAQ